MRRNYYILKSGRLRRKENTVYLETGEGKIPIPINGINSIFAFGELDINSKLLVFRLNRTSVVLKWTRI